MTAFFETRVENLEAKNNKKKLLQLPRNSRTRNPPRTRKENTPTPES